MTVPVSNNLNNKAISYLPCAVYCMQQKPQFLWDILTVQTHVSSDKPASVTSLVSMT